MTEADKAALLQALGFPHTRLGKMVALLFQYQG